MFYGVCKGTLEMGREKAPSVPSAGLGPPELVAHSLVWPWPLPALLSPAQLVGWYHPANVPRGS